MGIFDTAINNIASKGMYDAKNYSNEAINKVVADLNGKFVGNIVDSISVGGTNIPKYSSAKTTDVEYGSTASFEPIIKKIKASYGFSSSPEVSKMLEREYVNRLSVQLVDNVLGHMRCYVFMGKPTCALLENKFGLMDTTESVKKKVNLNELILSEPELYKFLNANIPSETDFLTPLQNRLVGISVQDATLSKSESAANTRGIRQEYPMSYAESMANIPISLTFSIDRNAEVIKLINAWVSYIEGVKEGIIQQPAEDAAMNRMSFTCPIWIFACEENAQDIIFWAKLVGNFPVSIPFSIFSNQGPINLETKECTVQFSSSFFKPFDMMGLGEFNALSENRSPKYFLKDYVPQADRTLNYYWVNGAQVVRDSSTGKLKLIFYTNNGDVDTAPIGKQNSGAGILNFASR